jgi:hypothetical protein
MSSQVKPMLSIEAMAQVQKATTAVAIRTWLTLKRIAYSFVGCECRFDRLAPKAPPTKAIGSEDVSRSSVGE